MLAIRLKQKDSVFYLAAYRASDLLRKVQFVGKAYEGEEDGEPDADESVVAFFRRVQSGATSSSAGPMRGRCGRSPSSTATRWASR